MPSADGVADRTTISGIGLADDDKRKVFKPGTTGARSILLQSNARSASVGAISAHGVNAKT